jgi:putative transposase
LKLISSVKLSTNQGSFAALQDTMQEANRCCNWLSQQAWNAQVFAQFKIHKMFYASARERFPKLASQTVVRCIAKVSDSYKLDKRRKRSYRLNGSIAYDLRILRWYIGKQFVSIWTTSGRLKLPYQAGERQRGLLKTQQGESDLMLFRGAFYLAATCNVDEPSQEDVQDVIGCDLGVANVLTDSSGKHYSGSTVKSVRHRHRRLRNKLQKKGTKSARRRLKALAGKETRFAKDTNHVISKRLVAEAQGTKQAIALEHLKGIRLRITVRRKQRAALHSWAFFQLRAFIAYKSKQAGVPVVFVDPRNTSRGCSQCGYIAKANRPSQSKFSCRVCGFTAHADVNAAWNIRALGRTAIVNQPNVASCESIAHDLVTSAWTLVVGR